MFLNRKVVKFGESEGRQGWKLTPVWYEGVEHPSYVYDEDVEVLKLQKELQEAKLPNGAPLTQKVMELIYKYGEACRRSGWEARDRG